MEFTVILLVYFLPMVTTGVVPEPSPACTLSPLYGKCYILANPNIPSSINGVIYLHQDLQPGHCKYDFLNVQVNINNLPVTENISKQGVKQHGFHIHQSGNMTDGCESMGSHYNPFNSLHGRPWAIKSERHVGGLGNVMQRGKQGNISTRIVDYLATLHGDHSIYGRGMVLHEKEDDLGNGGDVGSITTGNAGRRLACCVIKKSEPFDTNHYTLY